MAHFQRNLAIVLSILILIGAGMFSFYYWGKYSEGFRAGVVMKLSKKGKLFKTFEGQLSIDAAEISSGDPSGSDIWYFSIPKGKKQVLADLEDAILSGERVELEYYERYWQVPWRGKTKYFVTDVIMSQTPAP